MTNKIYTHNHLVPSLLSKITYWHEDRNLINGSTGQVQYTKGLEEYIEVYMALNPKTEPADCVNNLKVMLDELESNGRIKRVEDSSSLADGIGDTIVVLVNLAERENLTIQSCLQQAWLDIKDRTGKMINGIFVKEETK